MIPRYRAFARSLTTDFAEADDLVSEVTLKMIERDLVSSDQVNLEAYGMRAIKNGLIDRKRLAFSKHESIDDEDFNLNMPITDGESNPESSVMFDELLVRIRTLGVDCQQIMLMFFIEGKSYLEIADELSLASNTVGTRLLRCKKSFVAVSGDFL